MPSEAQLSRVNTISDVGKVANKTAVMNEQLRHLSTQQVQAFCCNAINTNNVAIASGGWRVVTLSSTLYDGYGMFAVGSPTRITCTAAGKYVVMANATWASSVAHASGAGLRIYKNGVTVVGEFLFYSCDIRSMELTRPVYLSSIGDYLELYVTQNTGAPVNLLALSDYSPTLGVAKYG